MSFFSTGGDHVLQQTLTAKILINPDEQYHQLLLDTMKTYADACSYAAERIVSEKIPVNQYLIHKAFYYDMRSRFGLPSQMTQSVIRTVNGAFLSIQTNQKEHPESFKKKKKQEAEGKEDKPIVPVFRSPQLSLVWNRDYSIVWNKGKTERLFSINTLKGRIKVRFTARAMEWAFAEGARFGTAKLVYQHGKFFLHIPVTVEVPDPLPLTDDTAVVGIDRGIRFLTVSYDGKKTSFVSGSEVKKKRAHYKQLRQELQKRKTRSARRRIKTIGQRENRWMNNVDHCLSKALVCSYPEGTLFVLEDLSGIRSATERVRVRDRYVSVSWSYYDLEQKLMYKAQKYGSTVIKVDPAYTSQRCPVCGHTERSNRDKKNHVFRCRGCGYSTNDDRTAAMNLHMMGKEYLMENKVS